MGIYMVYNTRKKILYSEAKLSGKKIHGHILCPQDDMYVDGFEILAYQISKHVLSRDA